MINNSKFALVAALAAISLATPASAQPFTKGDGTGNVLSFTYGSGGTKPSSLVVNEQIAVARPAIANQSATVRQLAESRFAASATRNLYNSTVVPFAGNGDPNSEAPAVTGGGSAGYNEMLKNY
jgi:hypothetical protein